MPRAVALPAVELPAVALPKMVRWTVVRTVRPQMAAARAERS